MTLIAVGATHYVDSNGNITKQVQTVSNIERVRQESDWMKAESKSNTVGMHKEVGQVIEERFALWGRDDSRDREISRQTKKAYKSASKVVEAVTNMHCTYRDAQVRIAEELVKMAQVDAKADEAIAQSAQEYQAARARSDQALAQIANIFGV